MDSLSPQGFTVKKAGIISKAGDTDAAAHATTLMAWLSERGIQCLANAIEADLDILIILGGDGTLLRIAETAARLSIPVIGINLGNLGFLTELTKDESTDTLAAILAGTANMEHRSLLSTRLKSGSSWSSPRYALNDVVISKNAVDRLFYLATGADGHHITTYRADGLVFSTPTGSTAYNLSAGGPLVHPDLAAILVTPICPFMLSSRPIMLPPTATITSHYLAHEGDVTAMVIVDGQQGWEMNPGDTLEVKMADDRLTLITSTRRDYFSIIRNKLNWASGQGV
jgi:NAD+ kinase